MGYVDDVSPAHAGMYRFESGIRKIGAGFPRTRGDVPEIERIKRQRFMFPPHTRGCTSLRFLESSPKPVSPAHAGMYRKKTRSTGEPPGFPRTRGDVPWSAKYKPSKEVFPPHTRGCTVVQSALQLQLRVSPAHAGMYPRKAGKRNQPLRFPRTRGDVPSPRICMVGNSPFPPHTRGCALSSWSIP